VLSKLKFILMSLALTSCATSFSAKKNPVDHGPTLAWDEILSQLQTGKIDIKTMDERNAERLEHSLTVMVKNGDWSRLTYIIDRLRSSPSAHAQILSLNLQAQLAFEQKDYGLVEKNALAILAIQSENNSAKLSLGLIYLYGGQFAKAIPYLNEVKDNPKALAALISAHRQTENNDLVDTLCERYQKEASEVWEVAYNCSLFEAQNMQSPEKALQILNASLSRQDNDSDASRELRKAITQIEVARIQRDGKQEAM
jgi:tetratricopeptide (TPR) repeat protein